MPCFRFGRVKGLAASRLSVGLAPVGGVRQPGPRSDLGRDRTAVTVAHTYREPPQSRRDRMADCPRDFNADRVPWSKANTSADSYISAQPIPKGEETKAGTRQTWRIHQPIGSGIRAG